MSSQSQISSESSSFVRELSFSIRQSLSQTDWENFSEQVTVTDRVRSIVENPKVLHEIQKCIENRSTPTPTPTLNLNRKSDEELKNWKFHYSKDIQKALALKESGNRAFAQGHNEKALEFYSQALAWIPGGDVSPDMAILHANRSAALFHMKEYSLAQTDIELALKSNYPSHLKYKLFERSARCYFAEGKRGEGVGQVQKALKVISKSLEECTAENAENEEERVKLLKLKTGLETLLRSCGTGTTGTGTTSQSPNSSSALKTIPTIAAGYSKVLKNATTKLSVNYKESEGRFAIATQYIMPGEVILVEKAFVSAVTPEFYHKHCLQCFRPLRAPIPCLTCATVSFCSLDCRNKAWETHHQFECSILGILRQSGISITCLMALRVLTQAGPNEMITWFDMVQRTENKSTVEGPPGDSEYRADHFSSLCQLVTHSDRRSPDDFFQRTIMALFILSLLKMTPFTKSIGQEEDSLKPKTKEEKGGLVTPGGSEVRSPVPVTAQENNEASPSTSSCGCPCPSSSCSIEKVDIVVGTLLLRLLELLQFNAHEVAGWDSGMSKSIFLGGGLFPTLAFFNHSCNPAIVRYFVNDTVIVRAVRTIQRGEPITENYGPVFTEMRRPERQAQLASQYWFDCACNACLEDWPLFTELNKDDLSFRCSFCRAILCKSSNMSMGLLLQCARCSKPTNILKSLKALQDSEGKYNQAIEFINKGRPESAVGILEENISLFDSILAPPFRDYHWCQEGLRKCYLAQGNETA